MNRATRILARLLALALVLLPAACGEEDVDRVERFAEADPGSGDSIAIPGFDRLILAAGETVQAVNLQNPPRNACAFVMTLALADGEVLWTGRPISPGEAFTAIRLSRPLEAGEYPATLRYDCYTLTDNIPLNGAQIQLTIMALRSNAG